MKKFFVIFICLLLCGCGDNNIVLDTDLEYQNNFYGYYKRDKAFLYENDNLKNSTYNINNEYMKIDEEYITFSYIDNNTNEFVSDVYKYMKNSDGSISLYGSSVKTMDGNYKIYHERSLLHEELILNMTFENIDGYNHYKHIDKDEYLVKYKEGVNSYE